MVYMSEPYFAVARKTMASEGDGVTSSGMHHLPRWLPCNDAWQLAINLHRDSECFEEEVAEEEAAEQDPCHDPQPTPGQEA